jgi:hypothetical protein
MSTINIKNQKFAVFAHNLSSNIDLIEKIKHSVNNYDDFCIFTNDMDIGVTNYGIINPYYLIKYNGLLIFLNIEDYIEYKDDISCDIGVYIDDYSTIDKNTLKKCLILTFNNNEIIWINNYELQ